MMTTKQKIGVLIMIICNIIIPLSLGIAVGKVIWYDQSFERIVTTIILTILGVVSYICIEISIILQINDFYKQNERGRRR